MKIIVLALFAVFAANAAPGDATAAASGPACAAQAPFYWEIGDVNGVLVSGAVKAGRKAIARDTKMSIASASKWPYGAYVNEVRAGALSADDIKFLTFKSGYTKFSQCEQGQTVAQCAAGAGYNRRADGKFSYSGGHMQKHAATFMPALGAMGNDALAAELNAKLGTHFTYGQPQLAGGVHTTAAAYAEFLQRIVGDKLQDSRFLTADAVPTQGPQALKSPVPEPWSYGRGHWVEQDGTASSPGAFGFYPWVSADKKLYGLVARSVAGGAWTSVTCGRAIRAAFLK